MMTKYNSVTADSSQFIADVPNSETDVSEATAANYLLFIRSLIDERIEKRIREGQDIARVYTAKIIASTIEDGFVIGKTTVGNSTYSVSDAKYSSITVEYNGDSIVTITNDTIKTLNTRSSNKYIKICTYDGVNFYVLHTM